MLPKENCRESEVLDLDEVKLFFSQQNYEVLEINQLWRHVHGKLKKGDDVFFFKLASTEEIGTRTKNEVSWNKALHDVFSSSKVNFFSVPRIIKSGLYQNKFYYVATYYGGDLLASKNPLATEGLSKWLDKITDINIFFKSLKGVSLIRDNEIKSIRYDYLLKSNLWFNEFGDNSLNLLLDEVKKLSLDYEMGLNHGDFVPWHMIGDNNKVILIDGEHASNKYHKYHDVCYFYHRLWTVAANPGLANSYLDMVYNKLSSSEKDTFFEDMRPILACRALCGFRDAKVDGVVDFKSHRDFKNALLNNSLFDYLKN